LIKAELRLEMAQRRADAYAADPAAGLALSALAPVGLFRPSDVVSAYWPYRTEIDPRPLMQRFESAGARLALPATPAKGSGDPLRFQSWSFGDRLHPRAFGVREPPPSAETVEPDILLIPLLAFDRQGGRLGYGAGHYDRTLERLRAQKSVLAIGLAFAAQEIERVPMDTHDQRLDAILTERAFIEVR
jgi:5-formyltetrahydrofolate cyclo-ligase